MIGKAIAHESSATFFSISSSSLTSKWIGEGEKLVKTLFAVASYRSPSVVFIDEIDSLLTQRKADEDEASRRMKTEFLVQLDGAGNERKGHVLVIGATNLPHELDDAARRRFVKRLYIPLPDQPGREKLLRTLLAKNSHSLKDNEIIKLSRDTAGYSSADVKILCTDASMGPMRSLTDDEMMSINADEVPPIDYTHFRLSLSGMHPSVAQSDLQVYLDWNDKYGSKVSNNLDDYRRPGRK
jgi:fidgetin-like protein 1